MGELTRPINLCEGSLPRGTAEREVVVATLLLVIRDALKPETRAEAMDWLETRQGRLTCAWIGVPAEQLRRRLEAIVGDREQLVHFTRLLCRHSPAELYQSLMAAA